MNSSIEAQLQKEGFYVSTTVGKSMWPMLRNRRDRVIIRARGEERLSRFDLPLYHRPDGRYVLHRILEVRDGHYVIRGDNTYYLEEVPEEQILGVMTEFYRKGKRISADDRGYRRYVAFWNAIYPLRHFAHRVRALVARILHRLFPGKKNSDSIHS